MEKVVHLLSSGLDSPVAAYLLLTAGFYPEFIFFDAGSYNSKITRDITIKLARKLAEISRTSLKLHACPHEESISRFFSVTNEPEKKYTCIFCKRVYYRTAKLLAERLGANAISTGEIFGEQASQTLENLVLIQQSIGSFLVMRPLLCLDKQEIIDMGRTIGTYEISLEGARFGCKAVPRYPITRGELERYLEIEDRIDIDDLIQHNLRNADVIEIKYNS
ncbi:MAG: hypothetical protein ACTSYS_08440 [Promethearchaeota archaeon]